MAANGPQPGRPGLEPLSGQDAGSYFESIVERFGGWVQYGDTKAGAVLVLLGLGLSNLIDNADGLANTDGWAVIATAAFAGALAAAAAAVFFMALCVLPFAPRHQAHNDSLLYYRDVASRPSAASYEDEVLALTLEELNHHRAVEAYGLAKIAERKAGRTRWALTFAGLFVFLWPAARVALALTH